MTKNERLQALIHRYKQVTGETAVDMDKIAEWAIRQGATLPTPKTARELFAAQLADAARAEYRVDPKTGLSYRANQPPPPIRTGCDRTELPLRRPNRPVQQ